MNWPLILTAMLPEHLLLAGMLGILGLEIRTGRTRDGFALALLSVAATVSRQQHCQERRHRRRCRWCRAGATADAFTLFERLEA